jgi:hypothetical protein
VEIAHFSPDMRQFFDYIKQEQHEEQQRRESR